MIPQSAAEMLGSVGGHNWTFKCSAGGGIIFEK